MCYSISNKPVAEPARRKPQPVKKFYAVVRKETKAFPATKFGRWPNGIRAFEKVADARAWKISGEVVTKVESTNYKPLVSGSYLIYNARAAAA